MKKLILFSVLFSICSSIYSQFNANLSVHPLIVPLQNNGSLLKVGPGVGAEIGGVIQFSKPFHLSTAVGYNAFVGEEFRLTSFRTSYLSAGLQAPFKLFGMQQLSNISHVFYQGTWIAHPNKFSQISTEKIVSKWRHHGLKITHHILLNSKWGLSVNAIHLWSWEMYKSPYTGQTFLGLGATYFIGPLTREKNKKTTDAQPLPSNEP